MNAIHAANTVCMAAVERAADSEPTVKKKQCAVPDCAPVSMVPNTASMTAAVNFENFTLHV